MDNTIDLLQIKIEKAKAQLPEDTLNAINAIDWKAVILGMRDKKGYSFEQLGDLELETELLLCGLLSPENYPKELESRMKLSKVQVNELVQEMNEKVFAKIKEELIKNTERKKIFARNEKNDNGVLGNAGINIIKPAPTLDVYKEKITENREEMLEKIEKPAASAPSYGAPKEEAHPILAQKLSSSVQSAVIKTEHTLDNITKTNIPIPPTTPISKGAMDPYREIPE
jgi:hypothetical protein